MKKFIKFLFPITIFLALSLQTAFSAGTNLSDIDGHQYQTAIEYLYNQSIIDGYDDGTFKPDNTVNRAELLRILVGGAGYGEPSAEEYNNCFPDVKDEWYAPYVCFAEDQNWVDGYDDGTFKPEKEVNKVEAMKMLVNSQGIPVTEQESYGDSTYTDVDFNEWYAPYMYIVEAMQIVDISGDFYKPDSSITRGEISNNIYRAMLILAQAVGSFSEVNLEGEPAPAEPAPVEPAPVEEVSKEPAAPTVTITSQTFWDITFKITLPAETGDSKLDSIYEYFDNTDSGGIIQKGTMGIEGNQIVDTWISKYNLLPDINAINLPLYKFEFGVINVNGHESEKVTFDLTGFTQYPDKPTISVKSNSANKVEFDFQPPIYNGSGTLESYSSSMDSSSDPNTILSQGKYSKSHFEDTMNNVDYYSNLSPNTTYTFSFWVINSHQKESEKVTITVTTPAS